MRVKFTVDGNPFGWQRAGNNRRTGAIYTQDKTREHERLVAWSYKKSCGRFHFPKGTYVEIEIIAFMRIPSSAPKWKKAKMLSGEIRPTVKPDWDNVGKLIGDALNDVAYDDDKSIVDGRVRKFYSDHPRTVIIISEATSFLEEIEK